MAGLFDMFNGGLLGGAGGLLGGNPFANKGNQLQMAGLGLLSGRDWQEGFKNTIPAVTAGRALDIAEEDKKAKNSALQAMMAENKLTPAQQQFFAAYPEAGAKFVADKMTPERPQWGVIGQDQYGNSQYGWISPGSQTVKPAQPAASAAEGPSAIPPPPPGVDPKAWRTAQTQKLLEGPPKIETEVEARKRAAAGMGIAPDNPAYQAYVLTGKMPREDAQPLTASDKRAIQESDEAVATNEAAIKALQQAKQISPRANSGVGASARATMANNLPDWMVPDAVSSPESALATTDLNNLITGNALTQLKSIFGAAPTEGERAILMELQGSSNLPDAARQKIYDRAIEMANRRLEFNRERAAGLRGGTYYKPGGTKSTASDGWQDVGGGVQIRVKQ